MSKGAFSDESSVRNMVAQVDAVAKRTGARTIDQQLGDAVRQGRAERARREDVVQKAALRPLLDLVERGELSAEAFVQQVRGLVG